MGSYEEQLKDLAYGGDWNITQLGALITAVEQQQAKLQEVMKALPAQWKGQASEILLARLEVHHRNLGYLKDQLYSGQQQITGNGQYSCAATCDSADRIQKARAAYESLPSTIVPQHVLDQVKQGAKIVEVATVGPVDVAAKGVGWIADKLLGNREDAARAAVEAIDKESVARAEALTTIPVKFDPLPTFSGNFEPVPDPVPIPGGTGGRLEGHPNGGVSGIGDIGGRPNPPHPVSNVGTEGIAGKVEPPYVGQPGHDQWNTGDPYPPSGTGDPYDTGGDGSGNWPGGPAGNGDYGGYDEPVYSRPSVDSGLNDGRADFGGVGQGLGAAGLGAVGLGAGAKLAAGGVGGLRGAGGWGGLGGLGAGGGAGVSSGGIGGIAGSTTGAGAGGASSSNANSGAAKGASAGRPGMMVGGQGGESSDKKSSPNRLGYVAPSYEDEYEENMPHPSARAGKRGE